MTTARLRAETDAAHRRCSLQKGWPWRRQRRPSPPLESGDRLSRTEFHRRYCARPDIKKAELVRGVVYVPSPVRHGPHSHQSALMVLWLGAHAAWRPDLDVAAMPASDRRRIPCAPETPARPRVSEPRSCAYSAECATTWHAGHGMGWGPDDPTPKPFLNRARILAAGLCPLHVAVVDAGLVAGGLRVAHRD